MKKRVIAVLLVVMMLMTTVSAASTQQSKTADALNHLQLFQGTEKGYELDRRLNRAEGITLLVRMIGKEPQAESENEAGDYSEMPFTDVEPWAKPYVGYAWKYKITDGISKSRFGGTDTMTDYMFLTLTLRALGYQDSGENPEFVWDDPYELAAQTGLVENAEADSGFTRGDAVVVFWNALDADLNGQNKTLADSLLEQKVFTTAQLNKARDIQKNGRIENPGVPVSPVIPNPGTPENGGNSGNSGGNENAGKNPENFTWEEYQALDAKGQQAFYESFSDMSAFLEWYNEAKAIYDEKQNYIEIGGGESIDLGDLIGKG